MKPLHVVMGGSLIVSAWFAIFGDRRPESIVVEPASRTLKSTNDMNKNDYSSTKNSNDNTHIAILELKPRKDLIGEDEANPTGELFGRQNWTPPAVPPSKPVPLPVQSTPPLSFTYLGKKREDDIWEVYLAHQDQTFIVREKTIIDGMYRVEVIKPPTLVLTYLPLSQKQTVMIGEEN